ncbi:uncharacterized protein LOC109726722 [Ananas comosus]|uniref:Uncharacterized protein LOC109726722 n=1 Tax=Ananas comosus TaxID=4615 RepID=A0A6P5H201_ANACO|nr:uncharacterized protein LOC109726722 [Ananas comosus]
MGETLTLTLTLLLVVLLLPHSRAVPMAIIVPDPSSSSSSSPPPLAAPPPTAGGDLPALPSDHPASAAAAPNSVAVAGAAAPEGGGGVPFIGSNPAVPIPTGVTDSATILPLPSPRAGGNQVAGSSGPSIKEGTATMVLGVMLFSIGLVLECFLY